MMADRTRGLKSARLGLIVMAVVMSVVMAVAALLLAIWPGMSMGVAAVAAAAGSGATSGTAAATASGTTVVASGSSGTEVFAQLFREGLQKHRESNYAAAAALFGHAEQAANMIGEKAQAAYFQGTAFFEAREYRRAEQSFQRVIAYGQAKYVGMAEIAARDCAACINPMADFPTGMYLWIKSRMGAAALASVDRYLNVWDNMKIYLYIIVLLIILWRVGIKIKCRKTKKA